MDTPAEIYRAQSAFFRTGATRDLAFRRAQITKLIAAIQSNEQRIIDAQYLDLHKSASATYTSDILIILQEARYVLAHIQQWAAPWRERSPLFLPATKSSVRREPYGSVLIITPFNVPFVGSLTLLVGALASGNCATIKVSELCTHSAQVLIDLIRETFPPHYVTAVTGEVSVSQQLLETPFDFIFFMGSSEVGKAVMTAAARHLSPVSLQLGGKCPAIVDQTVSIDQAAKRIVWAKFLNAGQECVSIDHLYVPKDRKVALIAALQKYITQFYGTDPQQSPDYERIINDKHFNRVTHLLSEGHIVSGGAHDARDRYIEPTIIDEIPADSPLSREEIFGPILPIYTYDTLDTLLKELSEKPSPLVIYVFSKESRCVERVRTELVSGTICVNDALVHNASFYIPVGGVGQSGFGRIHGRYTFDMFSRFRTVITRHPTFDLPGRYPPTNSKLLSFMRTFLG